MKLLISIALGLFCVFAVLGIGVIKKTAHWPLGELALLHEDLNRQVEETYRTGQAGEVSFKMPSNVFLLLSPAYAQLPEFSGQALSPSLRAKMQGEVNGDETGHLFLVKDGQLIEHRLLSSLAEPILGSSEGSRFVFSVTREETSARPVRIELVKK